jgi:hypothetical protein
MVTIIETVILVILVTNGGLDTMKESIGDGVQTNMLLTKHWY